MGDDAFDVISPELALVDPELAAQARAQLPEPGSWRPTWRDPGSDPAARHDLERRLLLRMLVQEWRLRQAETPAAPAPAAEPPRRRVSVAVLVKATAAAVVLAVMGALVLFDLGLAEGSRPVLLDGPPPAAPTPPAPAEPRAPAVPPASRRLFAWAPAPGASGYELRLLRRGRLIYRTTTSNARFTVPAAWIFRGRRYRLVSGRYAWQVRPRLGGNGRLGPPLVRATVDVP